MKLFTLWSSLKALFPPKKTHFLHACQQLYVFSVCDVYSWLLTQETPGWVHWRWPQRRLAGKKSGSLPECGAGIGGRHGRAESSHTCRCMTLFEQVWFFFAAAAAAVTMEFTLYSPQPLTVDSPEWAVPLVQRFPASWTEQLLVSLVLQPADGHGGTKHLILEPVSQNSPITLYILLFWSSVKP